MRLLLDILISAVFAVFVGAIAIFGGFFLAILLIRTFYAGSDDFSGMWLVFVIPFLGLIAGIMSFPICGIWLDQKRQKRKLGA